MKKIKMLFMDVDGTLTDGKIYMGQEGELFKAFNIKDGYGIHNILPKYNIIPIIITARESQIVKRRCEELGITQVYQGCTDKVSLIKEIAIKYGITFNSQNVLDNVAYIGDDLVDLSCMKICQYSACPADAVLQIKQAVNFVSKFDGGNGAVREFIDWLVE